MLPLTQLVSLQLAVVIVAKTESCEPKAMPFKVTLEYSSSPWENEQQVRISQNDLWMDHYLVDIQHVLSGLLKFFPNLTLREKVGSNPILTIAEK